jgi:hypothetical protein
VGDQEHRRLRWQPEERATRSASHYSQSPSHTHTRVCVVVSSCVVLQITIFGESAGATSVAVHLVSQYSQGLYSKAIIESNPFSLPIKTIPEVPTDRLPSTTRSRVPRTECKLTTVRSRPRPWRSSLSTRSSAHGARTRFAYAHPTPMATTHLYVYM